MSLSQYENKPEPFRLVMIETFGVCQFCKEPKGSSHIQYTNFNNNIGFISCGKKDCIKNMEFRKEEYLEEYGLTKLKPLFNKNIKVKRSSGHVDNDWIIEVRDGILVQDNIPYVYVKKNTDDESLAVFKYIDTETILQLNRDLL